jgi:hypothetical protein
MSGALLSASTVVRVIFHESPWRNPHAMVTSLQSPGNGPEREPILERLMFERSRRGTRPIESPASISSIPKAP